jgi:hypothetical protein
MFWSRNLSSPQVSSTFLWKISALKISQFSFVFPVWSHYEWILHLNDQSYTHFSSILVLIIQSSLQFLKIFRKVSHLLAIFEIRCFYFLLYLHQFMRRSRKRHVIYLIFHYSGRLTNCIETIEKPCRLFLEFTSTRHLNIMLHIHMILCITWSSSAGRNSLS